LFREARVLLEQRRYREACRMFERSLELDPSPGTLLNLGNCYEQEGDLARALATFERAVADSQLEKNEAKRNAWTQGGSQRLDALLARVPVLRLTPSPTPGALLRIDGEEQLQQRGPLRLNPGKHTLEVSAAGKRTLSQELELKLGEQLELALPELSPATRTESLPHRQLPEAEPRASSAQRAAWVLIGGGALLSAAGMVTALMANAKENELEEGCAGTRCTDPGLRTTRDSGERLELATYLTWAAGGASALIGVAILVLEEPNKAEASTLVSLGCAGGSCGLQASGSF
jgi:tetratricopeptide (TPR) repeat protein